MEEMQFQWQPSFGQRGGGSQNASSATVGALPWAQNQPMNNEEEEDRPLRNDADLEYDGEQQEGEFSPGNERYNAVSRNSWRDRDDGLRIVSKDWAPHYSQEGEHDDNNAGGTKSKVIRFDSSDDDDDDSATEGDADQVPAQRGNWGHQPNKCSRFSSSDNTVFGSAQGGQRRQEAEGNNPYQAFRPSKVNGASSSNTQPSVGCSAENVLFWSLDLAPGVSTGLKGWLQGPQVQVDQPRPLPSNNTDSVSMAPALYLKPEFQMTVLYLGGGLVGMRNLGKGCSARATLPGCDAEAVELLQSTGTLGYDAETEYGETQFLLRVNCILRTTRLAVASVSIVNPGVEDYVKTKFNCSCLHVTLALAKGVAPVESGIRLKEYISACNSSHSRRRETNDVVQVIHLTETGGVCGSMPNQGVSGIPASLSQQEEEDMLYSTAEVRFPYMWSTLTAH